MAAIMNRLLSAMNAHDLDAFVGCFAAEYESQQPAHPGRAFRGSDQVRKNWEGVFAGVPDFRAELVVGAVTNDGVELGEWRWQGTHTDGSSFGMHGVIDRGSRRPDRLGAFVHGADRPGRYQHRRDGARDVSSERMSAAPRTTCGARV
jgi:hypothetical protein